MRIDPHSSDRPLVAFAVAGLLLTLSLLALDASPFGVGMLPEQQVGKLQRTFGTVQRRHQGSLVWRPLQSGSLLFEGDSVFTGLQSSGSVRLDDGTTLEIDPSSLVVLERIAPRRGPSAVLVEEGGVRGQANARGLTVRAAGSTAALSPHAAAEVRVEGNRAEVSPSSGHVEVAARRESGVAVEPGTTMRVSPQGSSVVRWPVRLRSPEDGEFVRYRDEPPDVRLSWSDESASAASVQVACGLESPRRVMLAGTASGATLSMRGPGMCRWRVLDESGVELSEERRFAVVEDRPPLPLSPTGDRVLLAPTGETVLSWSRVSGTERYRVELARDAGFEETLVTRDVQGAEQVVLTLPAEEHRYHWRVRGAHGEPEDALWSVAESFRLTPFAASAAPSRLDAEVRFDAP